MTRARKDFVLSDVVVTCTTCCQPFNRPIDLYWRNRSICISCTREETKLRFRRNRVKNACKRYGITVDEYDALMVRQGGACGICGLVPEEPAVDSVRAHRPNDFLHVDHDHASGSVRGLLCHRCNNGIGHLGDNVERLEAAIRYLRRDG